MPSVRLLGSWFGPWWVTCLVLLGGCGDDKPSDDPCQGVTCSAHGTCVQRGAGLTCDCEDGFVAVGLSCLPSDAPDGGGTDGGEDAGQTQEDGGADGGVVEPPCDADTCGPVGCCADHCCAVTPANPALGTLEDTGLELTVPGGTSFDTSNDCLPGSALGDCEVVLLDDAPQSCVCRADELVIGGLEVTGDRSLVLLVLRTVELAGVMTVAPGAGSSPDPYENQADCRASTAGGSYGTAGGSGGAPPWGAVDLVPLVGGMDGQTSTVQLAGKGGGALQITAGESIRVVGAINAGGGGGDAGGAACGTSAGGSGGAILLEAPSVNVPGTLAANGGGGSANFSGPAGTDGLASAEPAPGGITTGRISCSDGDDWVGNGGNGSTLDQPGANGGSGSDFWCDDARNGGGGGGGGRIRINSLEACACTGVLSPTPTYGSPSLQ